jgi:AcrR family transcriptional regulator
MRAHTSEGRRRDRLTRERVLRVAMDIADRGGLEALSMRKLGQALGVEAMAFYHHFANKDEIVDGLIDLVFDEVEIDATGRDWRETMRRRALSLRAALSRHPWSVGLMESRRRPGPSNLRHHDAVIGTLLAGGFSMAGAAHAYSLLDSYIYGFALTKLNLPFRSAEQVSDVAAEMLQPFPADQYPNLVAFITQHALRPGYDYDEEFEPGLELVLDAIARAESAG